LALTLADVKAMGTARSPRNEGDARARKPARVLVVDDEAPVRTMIAAALERHGYTVEQASDGRDACPHPSISLNLRTTRPPPSRSPAYSTKRPGWAVHFGKSDVARGPGRVLTERSTSSPSSPAVLRIKVVGLLAATIRGE